MTIRQKSIELAGHPTRRILAMLSELGKRQHCCDNVTIFSGQKMVDYFIMSIFVVAMSI